MKRDKGKIYYTENDDLGVGLEFLDKDADTGNSASERNPHNDREGDDHPRPKKVIPHTHPQ